ncbi:MAG: Pr6Pr family membrane protein [Lachnospiraceae bacterium]|nr:Pr6Pr family membrane protein [Lachnospiraceae bacterium]
MKAISETRKRISYILKLTVIVCAVAGTLISAFAGRSTFMGGKTVFMYFTIQSNILIAAICAWGLFLLARDRAVSVTWYTMKLVGTVSITLTGVVFAFLLAPVLGAEAWNLQNTLTHAVVPIVSVADYFVVVSGKKIPAVNVLSVIIPPLLYAIYAGIGYAQDWHFARGYNYPYFFLNWGSPAGAFGFTGELPYMGTAWWILLLLVFLIVVGYCYTFLADRIGRLCEKRKDTGGEDG